MRSLTYGETELISMAFLVLAAVSFFVMAEYEPESKLAYALVEWFVRIALFGWIASVVVEVALFPRQFGANINALLKDIGW